jgi:membrane protein
VLAAEVNVVAHRHLWPRALLTPFTDRVRLTTADERAYTSYAESERHKGFEVIDVDFEQPADTEDGDDSGRPDPARRSDVSGTD